MYLKLAISIPLRWGGARRAEWFTNVSVYSLQFSVTNLQLTVNN